ncbi:ABC transporter ATP-binding protein [Roseomonas oryzicola]|uniref:ABC transporter ATP-binding protein n=2 Tax=Neoroseomonas oryzicola TaxID=535904 RepID=A0A9X9WF74_9PROT|nr:ABC transporter ATP-binding protein [Neoroseomonas oryzicola]NKE19718.1 ABC transporter ATP-binding protein [Neoroseomonas oryzicola]
MDSAVRLNPAATAASGTPLLAVEDLAIRYVSGGASRRVVEDVSFSIAPGEVVALVGESGSGKTTTAQAVLGLLPANGMIERGAIRLDGTDITGWSDRRLSALRGTRMSLIPQDPTTSLNPVRTVGSQIAEILQIHGERDRGRIRARVLELLARVGLEPAEMRAQQYPHQLSGGMRQRVLIAIAVALRPGLIVADEPTSALDVTVQRRVLDLLDDLRREDGTAVLLVTHDLGVAADRADRVVVLRQGRIQEAGPVRQVLAAPRSDYARQLLADAPSLATPRARPAVPATAGVMLKVAGLTQTYPVVGERGRVFRAADDVSFEVRAGTTHALVGESGSGKTTTARCIAGFLRPTSGTVEVGGTDVARLSGEQLRQFRHKVQLVFQNPFASLDPRQTIGQIVEEPLRNFDPVPKAEREHRVRAMIGRVGLPDSVLGRPPAALSGGQRQRVAIARALVLKPRVVVLDEAVSALDVTVQARILELLDELQRELGLTYVFVSHDLAVVRLIADTVSVMRAGQVVESGPVETVFHAPAHDYTRDLIAAIPGGGGAAGKAAQ